MGVGRWEERGRILLSRGPRIILSLTSTLFSLEFVLIKLYFEEY